jgi:ABC-type dipeptide/oligopeptide/nickel transport system permease component
MVLLWNWLNNILHGDFEPQFIITKRREFDVGVVLTITLHIGFVSLIFGAYSLYGGLLVGFIGEVG